MIGKGLRKAAILMLVFVLLFSMWAPVYADVASAAPAYPYGLNNLVDDQDQAKLMLRNEWETWKDSFVSKSGRTRVLFDGTNTVSEGMGYGMLMAVYFNEKTLFDEFYDYVKHCSDSKGLMHWKTNNGNTVGANSATDAEEDIALALIFADKVWGSDGQVDYETEAKTRIDKIRQYQCNISGQLLPGDTYSSEANPSYLAPGWYEIYKDFCGSSFWYKVKYEAYSLVKKAANGTTGLVPDWCSFAGAPLQMGGDFRYDAIRVLLRMAVSYSWYGEADTKSICSKPLTFFRNIGAANIVDGYRLDGTPIGGAHSAAFVACAAAGTMTGTDKQLAKTFYDECVATRASDYYGSTLRLLTLMYMTGNLQNLYQGGKQITTQGNTSPADTAQPGTTLTEDTQEEAGAVSNPIVKNTVLTISNMPIGAILEAMGGTYEWNDTEKKATIRWSGTTVELWDGQNIIKVNGVKKQVDIAPDVGQTTSIILPPIFASVKPDCIISWDGGSTQLGANVKGLFNEAAGLNTQKPVPTNNNSPMLRANSSSGNWGGVWLTNMGTMQLLQEGSIVIGTCGEEQYTISGEVSGNKLVCEYNDGKSSGIAEFTMSRDGTSFTGIYGNNRIPKSKWSQWNGKR